MISSVRSLAQLKVDAANGDWGRWCAKWGLNPFSDMHPNDERALMEGCYFDLQAAERVHRFFYKLLRVSNTLRPEDSEDQSLMDVKRPKTVPFYLLNWWYREVIGPIFGWKLRNSLRRFRKSFVTTAKKSGKSTVLAGISVYMTVADGEEQAECYSAAVDRDQAAIIFNHAKRMTKLSPSLAKRLKITDSQKRIYDPKNGCFFESISSDADSADGANPHLMIVDELHR